MKKIVLLCIAAGTALTAGCGQSAAEAVPAAATAETLAALPSTTTTTIDPTVAKIVAWARTYGAPDVDTLLAAAGPVIAAGVKAAAVDAACTAALGKVRVLQGHPTPPDTALADSWSRALSFAGRGYDACARGARTLNADLTSQATGYAAQSTEAVQEATAILGRYTN